MSTRELIFGAFVPQGWKMELSGIEGGEAKWARAVEVAVLADELGYDSIWVYDHFHTIPKPVAEAVFECWTTMAALSQRTSRIRLGQMVGCAAYRNPALLAKITATVDVISGGRLDWGIGAGWYEHEFDGYGYEFRSPAERIRFLRETVEVVLGMWSEPAFSYDGRFVQLDGALCDPKPVQQPHPPVWIGGGGEQLTLRVVARHADASNFGGKPHEWAHKAEVLQRHCKDVGRDYDEIRKTYTLVCYLAPTRAEAERRAGDALRREHPPFAGEPTELREHLEELADLGFDLFQLVFAGFPETDDMRLFADQVLPAFQ